MSNALGGILIFGSWATIGGAVSFAAYRRAERRRKRDAELAASLPKRRAALDAYYEQHPEARPPAAYPYRHPQGMTPQQQAAGFAQANGYNSVIWPAPPSTKR